MANTRGHNNTNQEPAEQTEQQLSHGPLGPIDRGQQVVDKVLKKRPVVLFSLLAAAPEKNNSIEKKLQINIT